MQSWEKQTDVIKMVDIVAITFPKTKFAPEKAVYTGIPLEEKKFQILK